MKQNLARKQVIIRFFFSYRHNWPDFFSVRYDFEANMILKPTPEMPEQAQ